MKQNITKKILRDFGIVFGLLFPFIIGFLIPLIFGHSIRVWTFFVGILFLFFSFLYPRFLFYPYKIWMFIGNILGFINSHLILGMVFICVLQPIAFLMKLIGYDPLRQKNRKSLTYREIRKNNKIDLERIF
tara:strand:- start:139 stop:531 length:393 start_codon:yes stop_codon:yes gene_type:complete